MRPSITIATPNARSIDTDPVRPSSESVRAAVGSRNSAGAGPKYMYDVPECSYPSIPSTDAGIASLPSSRLCAWTS